VDDLNHISTARRWWTRLDVHVDSSWYRDPRSPWRRLGDYVIERGHRLTPNDILVLCVIASTGATLIREAAITWKVARNGIVSLPQ